MHYATRRFWQCYDALPESAQRTADECYELLKVNPSHPYFAFQEVGQKVLVGSCRVKLSGFGG